MITVSTNLVTVSRFPKSYNCRISEILRLDRLKQTFFTKILRLPSVNIETILHFDTYLLRLAYLLFLVFFRKS